MTISTGCDPQPPQDAAHLPRRRRARTTQSLSRTPRLHVPSAAEEVAFWARYEEREAGRFTQEADHLFDTSYLWAA